MSQPSIISHSLHVSPRRWAGVIDNAPRLEEAARIGCRGERIDPYVAPGGRRMDESIAADGDSDMQFLSRQVHEYQVACPQFVPGDGRSRVQLLVGRPRQMKARAAGRVYDESTAIESAG
jgi:hypothetical protein